MYDGIFAYFRGVIRCMSVVIDILLSTYNGEKYLAAQLDSLIEQTFTNWRLLVRDDGSTDATMEIVRKYAEQFPEKVVLITEGRTETGLGAANSFSVLMKASSAPYIAFCDQDDIWLSDKLEKQLDALQQAENSVSETTPLLVHSDLIVVDHQLSLLSPSLWTYQHLNPLKMHSFKRLLLQNYVTGCTCLLNRALLEKALPVPDAAVMHDWWLALIAMDEGEIINMREPTVKYRQHAHNDTGAKQWGRRYVLNAITGRQGIRPQLSLHNTCLQAQALLSVEGLSDNGRYWAQRYVSIFEMSWLRRRVEVIRCGFWKNGFVRNVALMLYL